MSRRHSAGSKHPPYLPYVLVLQAPLPTSRWGLREGLAFRLAKRRLRRRSAKPAITSATAITNAAQLQFNESVLIAITLATVEAAKSTHTKTFTTYECRRLAYAASGTTRALARA